MQLENFHDVMATTNADLDDTIRECFDALLDKISSLQTTIRNNTNELSEIKEILREYTGIKSHYDESQPY